MTFIDGISIFVRRSETNEGKTFFTIEVCPKCLEYKKALQGAGTGILKKQLADRQAFIFKPTVWGTGLLRNL
uniref:Uncharacterized protein n=1 Tax=Romanomermis culicivorax TaxID=13658 RepID=A0A915J3J5_ROMCU